MTPKHHPLNIKRLLAGNSVKQPASKLFKLTLVHDRPKREAKSKVIRLTYFDFHEAFNPQWEFNRIRSCLGLPTLSIQDNTSAAAKNRMAPHTLHLFILEDELKAVPDYPKLLATIGYESVIDRSSFQLFINKRKATKKDSPFNSSNNELFDLSVIQS